MPQVMKDEYPYLTQDRGDTEPTDFWRMVDEQEPLQYIANMQDGSVAGYKYFSFSGPGRLTLEVRGAGEGRFVAAASPDGPALGELPVNAKSRTWGEISGNMDFPEGVSALYLIYRGSGSMDLRKIRLD